VDPYAEEGVGELLMVIHDWEKWEDGKYGESAWNP
jgi:hypothetical protein